MILFCLSLSSFILVLSLFCLIHILIILWHIKIEGKYENYDDVEMNEYEWGMRAKKEIYCLGRWRKIEFMFYELEIIN